MKHLMRTFLFIVALSALISGLDVPFTVEEPNATGRTGEGVSCGVPFAKGSAIDINRLALFGPGGEVSAQFNALTRYGDGSLMWALASFTADIAKGQALQYTVKTQSPAASPAQSIAITRSGSVVTINNGVLRFMFDTLNFTGIDSLYYKGTPVIGGKNGGIILDNRFDGRTYSNGRVTRAGFVYSGPQRTTYRIDGEFFKPDTGGIGFSYIITTFAGSRKIKLDIAIKNSINIRVGAVERITRCRLSFPLLFTPSATTSYKYATNANLLPDIMNFAGTGFSMSVHEDWGGGFYMYGGWSPAQQTRQPHNIALSGNALDVDVIVGVDSLHSIGIRGYENGPFLWLPDGFHKNSQIFLEFSDAALSATELQAKYAENKSALLGRPDPAYLSSSGAYGVRSKFGTIEDEKRMWLKFGCDTTGAKTEEIMPFLINPPGSNRSLENLICLPGGGVHVDFEEDPLEQYLIQWIRTGKRGYLDVSDGWAKYMKGNFTIHTTDYIYDGCANMNQNLRNKSRRTLAPRTGDPTGYIYQSVVDVQQSSGWTGCHFAGQGIVDYYCLTGDPLALESADDLAEVAWLENWAGNTTLASPLANFTWTPSMNPREAVSNTRKQTRPFKYLVHYVSRLHPEPDSLWFQRLRYAGAAYDNPWNKDPRGFLFSFYDSTKYEFQNWPQRMTDYVAVNGIRFKNRVRLSAIGYFEDMRAMYDYPVTVGMKPVNGGADTLKWFIRQDDGYWSTRANAPLEQYFELTGDEAARDYLIGQAQLCAHTTQMLDRCFTAGYTRYDFPDIGISNGQGSNMNEAHDPCQTLWPLAEGQLPVNSSSYAIFYPEVLAIGYRHTGDSRMLAKAFETWNRNTKRLWRGAATYLTTNYDLVQNKAKLGYVGCRPAGDEWATLSDRLTGGLQLFYEASRRTDTLPPEAVTDFWAHHDSAAPGKIWVSFTAPADRGGGAMAEYQVKYDTVPIVEYRDFNYAQDYRFPCKGIKRAPWWYALNLTGEPNPSVAGTRVSFALTGTFTRSDTYYVSICSRDGQGNLSPMSGVVTLTGAMIASELQINHGRRTVLSANPNPFGGLTAFSYQLATAAPVRLAVYDARGRMVRDFRTGLSDKPGIRHGVAWDGRDGRGQRLAAGVYSVRLTAGNATRNLKIILLR